MSILLNHSKQGHGPALIILHGLFGSSSNWRSISNLLSTDFTIYALDARNHGNSPWSERMTYSDMADDVAGFMDTHQIDNAHVLGHSMGGKTAMTFALRHSSRVNRLVVADISLRAYADGGSHMHNVDAMLSLNLSNLEEGRKQAERFLSNKIDEPKPVIQFLLQNLTVKNKAYSWRINLPVLKRSLNTIMGEVEITDQQHFAGSSLFIYGNNSDYVQTHDHDLIKSVFPNTVMAALDNAGHWLHAEQPQQFTHTVKEFLIRDSVTI